MQFSKLLRKTPPPPTTTTNSNPMLKLTIYVAKERIQDLYKFLSETNKETEIRTVQLRELLLSCDCGECANKLQEKRGYWTWQRDHNKFVSDFGEEYVPKCRLSKFNGRSRGHTNKLIKAPEGKKERATEKKEAPVTKIIKTTKEITKKSDEKKQEAKKILFERKEVKKTIKPSKIEPEGYISHQEKALSRHKVFDIKYRNLYKKWPLENIIKIGEKNYSHYLMRRFIESKTDTEVTKSYKRNARIAMAFLIEEIEAYGKCECDCKNKFNNRMDYNMVYYNTPTEKNGFDTTKRIKLKNGAYETCLIAVCESCYLKLDTLKTNTYV